MSLQVKIPPVPMTAPQCDDNDLTDDDFAKDSDDDFAKDSDNSDDPKKVSKEGAAFVQTKLHVIFRIEHLE